MTDWTTTIGCSPEAFCDELCRRKPQWVTGSLSGSDTLFLFSTALDAGADRVVEIGTASGFSTAVLCHALDFASKAGAVGPDFEVLSYDISPQYYADPTKPVGEAARELLPPELLGHIAWRHPATAADLKRHHGRDEVTFMFLDAAHTHPWPSLDLLASLDCLAPDARVVLHDINLPVLHEQWQAWGVKYLFDDLHVSKEVPAGVDVPNIGSIEVPDDKERFRDELLRVIYEHEWEAQITPEMTTAALA